MELTYPRFHRINNKNNIYLNFNIYISICISVKCFHMHKLILLSICLLPTMTLAQDYDRIEIADAYFQKGE